MTYNPLTIKRQSILGNLYNHCDTVCSIPVYMNDISEEAIGYVDESPGHYADGFVFHLPEDICKKLSVSGYDIGVDYSFTDGKSKTGNQRIKLNHIVLVAKQTVNPISRYRVTSAI